MSKNHFKNFELEVEKIYNELKDDNEGNVADYIPQLKNVDDNLFGISILTVDGKEFNFGDTEERFCIQSCSKTLTYALAIQNLGMDKVNQHIGIEPSGQSFNSFVFNDENKPFNALINAGAIVSSSLIKAELTEDSRFEYMMSIWKNIVGKNNVGFDNATYLSEKRTANRNRALSYVMMENNIFEEGTDIEKTLELYFQLCSITMDSRSMAKFAVMLANGGTTIDTKNEILSPEVVKSLLCVMYSSGMYDYSGRWGFNVGIPAKSGVSGCIFAVIPNLCGICVYSPKLDKIGNSYRGVKFFEKITSIYRLHIFDTCINDLDKKFIISDDTDIIGKLCKMCKENNLDKVKQILKSNGFDINKGDYDGRRALHIAVEEKHYECIQLLVNHGADHNVEDRWGITPIKKAEEFNDNKILSIFNQTD